MILLILDNCKMGKSYSFKKLDPCLVAGGENQMQRHPLMLVAQSGQETILKHPTVKKLLQLKWRFIPRLAFYSNLAFYLMFLLLFAIFSMRLSNHITRPYFTQTRLFRISSNTVKSNQSWVDLIFGILFTHLLDKPFMLGNIFFSSFKMRLKIHF